MTEEELRKMIDKIIWNIAQTHDDSTLWSHLRRDPEAFRSVVRHTLTIARADEANAALIAAFLPSDAVKLGNEIVELRANSSRLGETLAELSTSLRIVEGDLATERTERLRLLEECRDRNLTINALRSELRDREATIIDLRRQLAQHSKEETP